MISWVSPVMTLSWPLDDTLGASCPDLLTDLPFVVETLKVLMLNPLIATWSPAWGFP